MMCSLLLLKYVWKFENLQTRMFVYFYCVFNTLIYRYIAIVYVYRYVWKQNKLKNGKPVRKRIAFVTLPFFWISIYHCALSFFLFQDILFARLIASLSGWFLFFWSQTFLFLCILDFVLVCFLLSVLLPDFHYIVETLWKISWMFENMYFVKLFTSKHEKPKTC